MKRKIINVIASIFIICITLLVFIYSNKISAAFTANLAFIIKIILPSLFPFMIFVNFILFSNTIDYLAKFFSPIGKILKLSGYGMCCVIASLLGGFPYSSILVCSFIKDQKIDIKEGQRIAFTMFFPSLSFLFSTLLSMDKNIWLIILSLYLSSFLYLFILSFKCKFKQTPLKIKLHNDYERIYFDVMKNCFTSIFSIAFCIIFFRLISLFFALFIKNPHFLLFLNGLLEFSSTSIDILLLPSKTFIHYFILNFILTFSSFSIIMQSLFYLKQVKISIKKLLIHRLAITLISILIFIILWFTFI